jgi:hypothetical protein
MIRIDSGMGWDGMEWERMGESFALTIQRQKKESDLPPSSLSLSFSLSLLSLSLSLLSFSLSLLSFSSKSI